MGTPGRGGAPLRIIAGHWRGRKLRSPTGDLVRPTTDRTKEALFNILGPQVEGAWVLDLCCGAGGLGLEALSRGAARIIFVDRAHSSLKAAQINLELCAAEQATYQLECGESMAWLRTWAGSQGAPWILICDPPYQSSLAAAMMSFITAAQQPPDMVCAVIEYGPRTPDIPADVPGWQLRRYGESHLAIYRPGAEAPSQELRP